MLRQTPTTTRNANSFSRNQGCAGVQCGAIGVVCRPERIPRSTAPAPKWARATFPWSREVCLLPGTNWQCGSSLSILSTPVILGSDPAYLVSIESLQALERAFTAAFNGRAEIAVWRDLYLREIKFSHQELFSEQARGPCPGPERRVQLARDTLQRTRDALGRLPLVCPLPPPWLSVNLTALLIEKCSYGEGGGTRRAISQKKMRQLVANPRLMAKYLRADQTRARLFSVELAELDSHSPIQTAIGVGMS